MLDKTDGDRSWSDEHAPGSGEPIGDLASEMFYWRRDLALTQGASEKKKMIRQKAAELLAKGYPRAEITSAILTTAETQRGLDTATVEMEIAEAFRPEASDWTDPDWSMLDHCGSNLPEFPPDTFGPAWQSLFERCAHGAGVSVGHVATPLLATTGSLIGTARKVAASKSFRVSMTLWGATIGLSGSGKTPALDVIRRPLSQIQRDNYAKIAELRSQHEAKAETAKATLKKWKEDVAAAVKDGVPPPPRPSGADALEAFVEPRMFVADATTEKVAVLLQARPRGMAVIRDELAGHLLNMGRYTTGSDREFYLEAYMGNQYTVERIGRPPVLVDHLAVGLVGGLQPDKLARCFQGDEDGFSARFLFAWPEEAPYRPLSDDADEIEPELYLSLRRIVDLVAEEDGVFAPRLVPLSTDAKKVFESFRKFNARGKTAVDGLDREWWVKGPGAVLRLAGVLTFLSWSLTVGDPEPTQIDDHHLSAAVKLWREYFWPHARAAIRQIEATEKHTNTRRTLRWIQANGKTEISVQDIRRDALRQRLNAKETDSLIEAIAKEGFLRETTVKTKARGRPMRRWSVNPKLHARGNGRGAEE